MTRTRVEWSQAALAWPASVDRRLLDEAIRHSGVPAFVDLEAVGQLAGEDVALRLDDYAAGCERFWDRIRRRGPDGAGDYVVVHRLLRSVRQRDDAGGRCDLVDETHALAELPGIADAAAALLGDTPNTDALDRWCAIVGGRWSYDGPTVVVELETDMDVPWPDALGGPRGSGEVRRILRLVGRHASWRDRRSRRLLAFSARAEELWPDPEALLDP